MPSPQGEDLDNSKNKKQTAWRDTLNGVSRQFYSPAASDITARRAISLFALAKNIT